MSQILVGPELVKIPKLSKLLRTCKVEQCTGDFRKDNRFCAMGAIMNKLGWDGDYHTISPFMSIVQMLGLNPVEQMNVQRLNDFEGHSFTEIADYLESKQL